MINFTNLKLRYQLRLLVIFATLAMILVQLLYYLTFESLTKKRAQVYFNGMLNQIETKMVTINEDVERIANLIAYSPSIQKYVFEEDSLYRFKMSEFVRDNLNYTLYSNNNIQNIAIVGKNIGVMKSSSDDIIKVYNNINKQYELENYKITEPLYTAVYKDDLGGKLYYAYITPIYSLLKQPFDKKDTAACIILLKVDIIQTLIDSISMPQKSIFIVHDKGKTIIASNDKDKKGTKLDSEIADFVNSLETHKPTNNIIYNKKECLYQLSTVKDTGWTFIFMVPIVELTKDMKPLVKVGFIISISTTIILLIIGSLIINNITNPISNIISDMSKIGDKNNEYRIRIPGSNEIGKIADNINLMLENIDTINKSNLAYKENLFVAEIAKKQAELSFLQSQVNPHFLYNTLECIKNIAIVYSVPEIIKISTSMARIFRYSIKENEIVSIREEIGIVKDYFSIISTRFMDKYEITFDLKDEILDFKMLKMVLQPIVENSVYHGLEVKGKKGMVWVNGYCEESLNKLLPDSISRNQDTRLNTTARNIVFEIKDNGGGMTKDKLNEIGLLLNSNKINLHGLHYNTAGVGLLNIDRRLKLKYGEYCGISILSEYGKGTIVKFKIPLC